MRNRKQQLLTKTPECGASRLTADEKKTIQAIELVCEELVRQGVLIDTGERKWGHLSGILHPICSSHNKRRHVQYASEVKEITMTNASLGLGTRKSAFETRRDKAAKRFLSACEADDGEAQNMALDALVVAHLAATFELDGEAGKRWQEYKENAVERFTAAWQKCQTSDEDSIVRDELYAALDVLAVAHIAATFERASGPLEW